MFFIHNMFSLELIALVLGAALLIFIKINDKKIHSGWLNFIAWFVIIFSAISIICSGYYVIKIFQNRYIDMPKYYEHPRENYMERHMQDQNQMEQNQSK
ncbi:MAG: hypothetical protein AMS24_03250 [Chlamydiae bacterium SM23_39]|nr:MAG: hypothetical protein AMS24_03250 [Chlamydiae bacterium SM23_39]